MKCQEINFNHFQYNIINKMQFNSIFIQASKLDLINFELSYGGGWNSKQAQLGCLKLMCSHLEIENIDLKIHIQHFVEIHLVKMLYLDLVTLHV